MRIGELARRSGVSTRSLRYYDQLGLLPAQRTAGGHRDYPEGAIDRVIRIQELFAAGVPSRRVADLLPCLRDVDGGPAPASTPALATALREERARLDRDMAALRRNRDVLDGVIEAASGRPDEEGRR